MDAFHKDEAHFNYRVAGVAIRDGHILLDRNSRNSYWVFPGGHPEMMETMASALQREVCEEIGAEVRVVRLLWVLENFFHSRKHDIHELSFYFLMDIDPSSPLMHSAGPFHGDEGQHELIFQWHPLDEAYLTTLPLFPSNLVQAVLRIPETTQHIVFHDTERHHEPTTSRKIPKSSSQRLTIS